MEPDEFLSRGAFHALSEEDQARYVFRFMAVTLPVVRGDDDARKLDYIEHFFDLVKWMQPPDEYDRLVVTPLWNVAWENAQYMRTVFEKELEDLSLSDQERDEIAARIESLDALIEHKRNLGDLPE